MAVMSLKYQVRDIVTTTSDFGGRTFVILEVGEKGYLALEMRTKKRYPLQDAHIALKVGEADHNSPLLMEHLDEHDSDAAEIYCNEQARSFPDDKQKWLFLAKLPVGSRIQLVHRKMIYPAVFVRVNLDKPTYPIRAKIKELAHDFRLDALIDLQVLETTV